MVESAGTKSRYASVSWHPDLIVSLSPRGGPAWEEHEMLKSLSDLGNLVVPLRPRSTFPLKMSVLIASHSMAKSCRDKFQNSFQFPINEPFRIDQTFLKKVFKVTSENTME